MLKSIGYRTTRLCSTWVGLAVDHVVSDVFGGRVVQVVSADETASACPSCAVLSVSLKGMVCTRSRDLPYGTRVLRLIWHKRPVAWQSAAVFAASFTESLPAVRARSRLTTRLRTELGHAIAEQGRVVSESAAHGGVDWSIVHAAFVAHVKGQLAAPLTPVRAWAPTQMLRTLVSLAMSSTSPTRCPPLD